MVKFMIAGAINKRNHPRRRPREIIAAVGLTSKEELEDNPNEKHRSMASIKGKY